MADHHPGSVERAFRLMLNEASDRVLSVSPPYGDRRVERAFLSGYEAALRDIAEGELTPRTAKEVAPS